MEQRSKKIRYVVMEGPRSTITGMKGQIEVRGMNFYELVKSEAWKGRHTLNLPGTYQIGDYDIIIEVCGDEYPRMKKQCDRNRYVQKQYEEKEIQDPEKVEENISSVIAQHYAQKFCDWSIVEEEVLRHWELETLYSALTTLNHKELKAIFLYFFCEEKHTSESAGRLMGISRKSFDRLKIKSLKKMRDYFNKVGV